MIVFWMTKKILIFQIQMKCVKVKIFLKKNLKDKAFFGKKIFKKKLKDLRKNFKNSK